jgi:hypothetical protein
MRAQTERKYRNLSEVKSQKAEEKKKEDYRTNRLMAEIFAKVSRIPLHLWVVLALVPCILETLITVPLGKLLCLGFQWFPVETPSSYQSLNFYFLFSFNLLLFCINFFIFYFISPLCFVFELIPHMNPFTKTCPLSVTAIPIGLPSTPSCHCPRY